MNIGDYVRTKYGEISKIKEVWENERIFFENIITLDYITTNSIYVSQKDEYIIKSSPNIIDLIEVEDYVNGYLVYEIKENCVMVGYKCFKTEFDNEEDFLYQTIYANDIKSILTKEQFESMEYKVGDKE